jgi:hypothetical protein
MGDDSFDISRAILWHVLSYGFVVAPEVAV